MQSQAAALLFHRGYDTSHSYFCIGQLTHHQSFQSVLPWQPDYWKYLSKAQKRIHQSWNSLANQYQELLIILLCQIVHRHFVAQARRRLRTHTWSTAWGTRHGVWRMWLLVPVWRAGQGALHHHCPTPPPQLAHPIHAVGDVWGRGERERERERERDVMATELLYVPSTLDTTLQHSSKHTFSSSNHVAITFLSIASFSWIPQALGRRANSNMYMYTSPQLGDI